MSLDPPDPQVAPPGDRPQGSRQDTGGTGLSALYSDQLLAMIEHLLVEKLEGLEERLLARLSCQLHDSSPGTQKMLTEKDLAERLRCGPRTVRRLERSGAIPPSVRIGGSKRWLRDDIEEWGRDLGAGQGTLLDGGTNR